MFSPYVSGDLNNAEQSNLYAPNALSLSQTPLKEKVITDEHLEIVKSEDAQFERHKNLV